MFCPKCETEVEVLHKLSGDICSRCRTVLVEQSPWRKFFIDVYEEEEIMQKTETVSATKVVEEIAKKEEEKKAEEAEVLIPADKDDDGA